MASKGLVVPAFIGRREQEIDKADDTCVSVMNATATTKYERLLYKDDLIVCIVRICFVT